MIARLFGAGRKADGRRLLLRTAGGPKISMNASILGAVTNIVLDPLLIFGQELGAAGAAMVTIVGYICSDIYAVGYIRRHCGELSLNLPELSLDRKEVQGILSIGLAAAVTNFTQTLGIAMTNRSLLPYGSDAIAVMGIVMKILMIVALVVVGLAFGGQPLIGYNYGAKNKVRMKKVIAFEVIN